MFTIHKHPEKSIKYKQVHCKGVDTHYYLFIRYFWWRKPGYPISEQPFKKCFKNKEGKAKFECDRTIHILAICGALRWGNYNKKKWHLNKIFVIRRNSQWITIIFGTILTYLQVIAHLLSLLDIIFHPRLKSNNIKINITNTY